ncbi:GNAT family N-acetyltransferase [Streptomyces justiciae]|uniref:GNAT family N-acetyltransferase n=1 Tax=Streptomyces justiciae TaxID=2780140 RepID=UPI002117B32F|nr:GNAT family N-acetyltransferase [Streptomyces justiciae]MCW8380197.1 GNAT family N-acetyltransferase [Streptomyces justiciae]
MNDDAQDVTIRRATPADAAAAADVWLRSFDAALPTVVRPRSDDEVRDYIRDVVVPLRETWVAETTGPGKREVAETTDPGKREVVETTGPGKREVVGAREVAGAREIVGIMVLDGDLLSQLYLAPDWRGRGIGDRFVALAKERSPRGLQLWTFQVNKPAHRFYERHGFVAVEHTDGRGNEEREPDVRYVWRP